MLRPSSNVKKPILTANCLKKKKTHIATIAQMELFSFLIIMNLIKAPATIKAIKSFKKYAPSK